MEKLLVELKKWEDRDFLNEMSDCWSASESDLCAKEIARIKKEIKDLK